ncbi:hypothetical protein FQA39_LY03162 [Lamprigera yunnana]|nr:hypothetical protein FQA39_LY03162 [Lamprigera yunnana]
MWIYVLAAVISIFIYEKVYKVNNYWKEKGVPYVQPWPVMGNMLDIVFQRAAASQVIKKFYDAFPNSRYIGIYQFRTPTLLIRSPSLIKQITVKDFASFPEHSLFNNDDNDVPDNKGLFSLGAKSGWGEMRKTLNLAFGPSRMKEMFPLMNECGDEFIAWLRESGNEIDVDLKETFTKLGCNTLARCFFGLKCNCFRDPVHELYRKGNQINDFSGLKCIRIFGMSISRTLTKWFKISLASHEVSTYFMSLIKKRLQNRRKRMKLKPDMIKFLQSDSFGIRNPSVENDDSFTSDDAPIKTKKFLDEDEMAMQLLGFFIGGFDAIPALLSYAFYELAVNTDVQHRLREEINENCFEDHLAYDDLVNMKYLDMVTSEVLRKWPVSVFIDRKCTKPFIINSEEVQEKELIVEPGVICWIPIFSIHRDPKYYPDPEKFDPERFCDQSVQRTTYFPFGCGPRTCIASRFSVILCKLILVKVLQDYNVISTKTTKPPSCVSKIVIFLSGRESNVMFQARTANASTNT